MRLRALRSVRGDWRAGASLAFALTLALTLALPTNASRAATAATAAASIGRRAPAFVVARSDGGELSSARYRDTPLLVNVFAAWCATCHVEEPLLVRAYAKYRRRVAFLGIDEQEGVARASAYARELQVPFPIALDDGQFGASYDTSKIPETILVDRRGVVRAIFRGLVTAHDLDRALARIAE